MDKLKPCPFCGGEAEYSIKKIKIECTKCNAEIRGVRAFRFVPNYQDYLSRLWNRRTEERA